MSPLHQRIRNVVRKIPRGRVMTYGDVAFAADMPGAARVVGYAMHTLGEGVPWQRVLGKRNARTAHITIRDPHSRAQQRELLEDEGVVFSASGGVDLATFGHSPRASAPRSKQPAQRKSRR